MLHTAHLTLCTANSILHTWHFILHTMRVLHTAYLKSYTAHMIHKTAHKTLTKSFLQGTQKDLQKEAIEGGGENVTNLSHFLALCYVSQKYCHMSCVTRLLSCVTCQDKLVSHVRRHLCHMSRDTCVTCWAPVPDLMQIWEPGSVPAGQLARLLDLARTETNVIFVFCPLDFEWFLENMSLTSI